jgi:hypothetical protein
MISRSALLILAAVLTILSFVAIANGGRGELWRPERIDGWYEVLDLSSNAFYLWHDNALLRPLTSWIGELVTLSEGPLFRDPALQDLSPEVPHRLGAYLLHLLILLVGLAVLLRRFIPELRSALPVALITTSMLALALGRDGAVIAALAWSVLLGLLFSIGVQHSPGFPSIRSIGRDFGWYGGAIVVGLLSATSTIHYSIAVVAAGLLIGSLMIERRSGGEVQRLHLLALLAVLPALAITVTAPNPFSPHYPEGAHVVPDDEIPDMVRPLIGPAFIVPVIDQHRVREEYLPLAIGVALLALALLAVPTIPSWRRWMLGAMGVFTAAELLLIPELTPLLPLSTAQRLIPGLFYLPLVPLALGVTLVGAVLNLCRSGRQDILTLSLTTLAGGLLLLHPQVLDSHKNNSGSPFLEFAALVEQHGAQSDVVARARLALISPSHHLLKDRGLWQITDPEPIEKARVFRPPFEGLVVTTSNNADPGTIGGMFDRKPETRWSPGGGAQRGGEWFCVQWHGSPLEFDGVEIDPSAYFTDFPRGLLVAVGTTCPQTLEPNSELPTDFSQRFRAESWQGQIGFTPDRYPYYMTQDNVRVLFEGSATGNAVFIKQIGAHAAWDWSVSEFRLVRRRMSSSTYHDRR